MKALFITITLLLTTFCYSQSVDGKLLINNSSKIEIKLKDGNAVELFKQFKIGTYQVKFIFESKGLPLDEQNRQVALVEFETTLFKDGKQIGTVKRKPMPFFPGEMLEPVESFDIIHLLSKTGSKLSTTAYPGKVPPGKYEVRISANVIGDKGTIAPISIIIFI
ncbi:hypothetical protein [Nonlabens ulvanivorans]|uniref:hypothetical protein n=1 Tax=Nonlabens ulvanivorans TaxID=906888 RepID=UPI0037C6320C